MVVDQNFLKVKKYFLLVIFFLLFASKSYSNNYTFTKIIELDKPWGSSFINNNEIKGVAYCVGSIDLKPLRMVTEADMNLSLIHI